MKAFEKVKISAPKKNKFNLSHERKMSFPMNGNLIPMMVQEVLPSDVMRIKSEMLVRMQAMLAPIMHRVDVKCEMHFVPMRIVWNESENFITGGRLGDSAPVHPYIQVEDVDVTAGLWDVGSLADYMGLPTIPTDATVTSRARVSALPFRAYQLIYDEYYRDQNVTPSIAIEKTSGAVGASERQKLLTLRKRAWEKDYFTAALPFAQRGPAVSMPVEGDVDIDYFTTSKWYENDGGTPATGAVTMGTIAGPPAYGDLRGSDSESLRVENIEQATVSGVQTTINDLRLASSIQRFFEKAARVGSRYTEYLRGFFNVKSSDARLQRPEYLCGSVMPMRISEVLSTFQDPDDAGLPQGNMAGHGISVGSPLSFKRFFEEHGFIIGTICIMPKTNYQNGIPKFWQRFTKFDYYNPELAHLGEQEIKNSELYYDYTGSDNQNNATFGYQSRSAEYKYNPSTVHGSLRTTLDFWHMGRKFFSLPGLNTQFIESNPTNRIFADQNEGVENIICVINHRIDAVRPLPYYSTPSL